MPKFTVDYESSHSAQEAYSKLKNFLKDGGELKKFDSKVQCDFSDANQSAQLKGSQFKAEVKVAVQGTGSKVSVTVDLPLLLTPLKGKVQESLTKMLGRHLS